MSTGTNTALAAAKSYIEKGYSVIPIEPKGKKPVIPWKEFQHRRATPEEIFEWFGNGSGNNIGIVTGEISGIDVIDIDSREALDLATRKGVGSVPTVKTGKGYHFYYKHRSGAGNFQKRDDLPGIDFRAEGGYVLAPPSVHPSGRVYEWEGEERELKPLPSWILENGKPQAAGKIRGVCEGERNQTLARLCGNWIRNLSISDAMEQARAWNTLNVPPLPDQEVQRTVESIYRREQSKPAAPEAPPPVQLSNFVLTPKMMTTLDIPPQEECLDWLKSRSINMVHAPRGTGKSLFALELVARASQGAGKFLAWDVKRKWNCVYIDGEMSLSQLKERYQDLGIIEQNFILISQEWLIVNGVHADLNLATQEGQFLFDTLIEDLRKSGLPPDLIVFDNVSALCAGVDQYNPLEWEPVNRWLIRKRHDGLSIILVDHAGKDPTRGSRGTSAKEDPLDVIVSLTPLDDSGGCHFRVEFTKTRSKKAGASKIEARLVNGRFVISDAAEGNLDRIKELIRTGVDKQSLMAKELGISEARVSQLIHAAVQDGKLFKINGKLKVPG